MRDGVRDGVGDTVVFPGGLGEGEEEAVGGADALAL